MMEPIPIDEIRRMRSLFHDRKVNHTPRCTRCGQPSKLTDKQGNRWCEAHRIRYELLNWGHDNAFPDYHFLGLVDVHGEVQSAQYAVGKGYAHWYIMCGVGDDLYVECMHHAAFPPQEDEV